MSDATITAPKRWTAEDELLEVAGLNAGGQWVAELKLNLIGAAQLITADVQAIITEQQLGLRATYTFKNNYVLAPLATDVEMATISMPDVRVGNVAWASQVAGVPVWFNAVVREDGEVNLRGYPVNAGSGYTVPAGSVINIVVFTTQQSRPRGTPGGPPDALEGDTGYMDVIPGKVWQPGDAISALGLDAMETGLQLTLRPSSVGRRELDPGALEELTATIVGGKSFKAVFPIDLTIGAHNATAPFPVSVPGALTTGIVVMPQGPRTWTGYVSPAGTVNVSVKNITDAGYFMKAGTTVKGRVL